jgi:hypothetical protein
VKRSVLAASTTAFIAALLFSGVALTAQSPSKHCEVDGRVITANEKAVVFRKGPPDQYTVFACLQATRQTQRIGAWDDVSYGEYGFNLGGKYLGYVTAICSHGTECFGRPHIRNLATGSIRNGSPTPPPASDVHVRASRNGSMAWMRVNPDGSVRTLRSLESSGEHALDMGPQVAGDSLALVGRMLYWLHGDLPRTHHLD